MCVWVQVPSSAAVHAEVAELADAHGSGPCDGNIMRVQVPSSALHGNPDFERNPGFLRDMACRRAAWGHPVVSANLCEFLCDFFRLCDKIEY